MVRCSGVAPVAGLLLLLLSLQYGAHAYGAEKAPSSYGQNSVQSGYASTSNVFVQQVPTYTGGQPPQTIPAATSCYVDMKCFSCSPGFSIAQGYPFERRTPVTCEECLDLCLEKQSNPYPYCCRSVVYDFAYRTCDLFAVDGKSPPQVVTKYSTRSYFVPTGQCTKKTTVQEPDGQQTEGMCSEGELPKIVEVPGYEDPGVSSGSALSGHSMKECAEACVSNKDKDGNALSLGQPCAAVVYQSGECRVSSKKVDRVSSLRSNPDSTYMMIECFPEKLVTECPNNFVYAPKHVLVGFAKAVVTASSERECIEQCLASNEALGFYCKSGMYYYEDNTENCILNTESRSTQPNVYTEEATSVVYFELGCGRTGRRLAKKFRKSFSQALFDLPLTGLWTAWSKCTSSTESSVRYRTCRDKDVRNCPKETRSCSRVQIHFQCVIISECSIVASSTLPTKPSAGRFPDDDLRKRKKDQPHVRRHGAYGGGSMAGASGSAYGGGSMAGISDSTYAGASTDGGMQSGYGGGTSDTGYGQVQVPVYGQPAPSTQPGIQYPVLVPQQPMCPFDPQCFKASPECTISNAYPFERRTPVTCNECLDLCLEKQFGEYPYICKSAVYDSSSKSCDIFAVDGLNSPQHYLKYPGRSIYRPTGVCQPHTTTAGLPEEVPNTCPEGLQPKVAEIAGYGIHSRGQTLPDHNAQECSLACLTGQDKSGNGLDLRGKPCRTASYSTNNGCQVDSSEVAFNALNSDPDVTTFKVLCLPEEIVADCPNNLYFAPHHVLVGFAKQVGTAQDETECIMLCAQAYESTGFNCASAMYYYSEKSENCILNTEDRRSQPEVYSEDDSQVVYFELRCAKRRMKFSKSRFMKDSPVDDDWTEWSNCKSPDDQQVRYRQCDKKDIRDCPSQRRKCKIVASGENWLWAKSWMKLCRYCFS
ncbi:PAN 1 domain containing protein [Trichuris trichiura]|uniref:PAN 1 domain containing protein n=1 Tax=Trichuris trichiura TaxID=36087 RepID=A0A077Z0B4_TRITR|nr:PAN 1 domain containing protein [Trichuris trichiura]